MPLSLLLLPVYPHQHNLFFSRSLLYNFHQSVRTGGLPDILHCPVHKQPQDSDFRKYCPSAYLTLPVPVIRQIPACMLYIPVLPESLLHISHQSHIVHGRWTELFHRFDIQTLQTVCEKISLPGRAL